MPELLRVTRSVYRVADFLSWQRRGQLVLRPRFQRGSVWSAKAKSFFIDSIVRGFPVPLIFLQEQTDPETYEARRLVVDGQQRLRTVLAYVDRRCLEDADFSDEFDVKRIHNADLAGRSFSELDAELRDRILNFEFSVHTLPSSTSNELILELFARMNATGTRLNDQEVRNAKFAGAFKQLAYTLTYEQLDRWLEWRVFTTTQVARMRDAELTSELLLLLLRGLAGKNQRAIDAAYKKFDDEVPRAEHISQRLRLTFDLLEDVYSEELNELYQENFKDSPYNTQSWFYALFAMLNEKCFGGLPVSGKPRKPAATIPKRVRTHLQQRTTELREGEFDDDLLKALRGASTDKKSREERVRFLSRRWNDAD